MKNQEQKSNIDQPAVSGCLSFVNDLKKQVDDYIENTNEDDVELTDFMLMCELQRQLQDKIDMLVSLNSH